MICPACREDFEPEVTHCPYCGALSPFGARSGADSESVEEVGPLVPLVEIRDPETLSRLCDALHAAGVPFLVQGQSSFRSLGVSALLRGEEGKIESHEVLVPELLVPEATRVLDELDESS
jgi:hypothetical protein